MGVATSCEKALDYYRRVAQSVADEVSFSGGPALQRVRLQDEIENGGYTTNQRCKIIPNLKQKILHELIFFYKDDLAHGR